MHLTILLAESKGEANHQTSWNCQVFLTFVEPKVHKLHVDFNILVSYVNLYTAKLWWAK